MPFYGQCWMCFDKSVTEKIICFGRRSFPSLKVSEREVGDQGIYYWAPYSPGSDKNTNYARIQHAYCQNVDPMLSKSENNLSKIPVNLVTPPGGLAILSNSERGGASESLAD